MLSYARNQQSNILQMTTGYWAFADNATKQMMEILHRMGILVTYETIWEVLRANAEAQVAVLQEKAWTRRFFVSYDNMNFHYKRRDQRVHNKSQQVAYTAGYICFMRSDSGNNVDANWEQMYLDSDQVDHSAVESLVAEDFLLRKEDLQHQTESVRHTLSDILAAYFPVSLFQQKICGPDGRQQPLYQKFEAPLQEVRCSMEKADLLPLPTLALDKSSIAGTIDILKEYLERLGLEDIMVREKRIMFKGDYLTVHNITRAIFWRVGEERAIDNFQFIEPVAGMFHLQINVLKLFLGATWGAPGNSVSLARFQKALSQVGVTKDAKDFHVCDNFFRTVVMSLVIALCMQKTSCKELLHFKTWLSGNNWPELIQNIADKHLDPFKPTKLRSNTSQGIRAVRTEAAAAIAVEKNAWRAGRAQRRDNGEKQPN